MNKLFTILLLCVTVSVKAQLTKIGNWNAYVHDPGVKAPLLIAFHGDGQAGAVENLTKKDGLAVLLKAGWRPPYTYFIVCPQSPSGSFPDKDIPTLLKLIAQKYPNADTTGYRTTGFSSGAKTCLEGIVHKPKQVLVLSAAGGGASLVNFIAQNKIPIVHWTGSNESDHINWTLYQINQKVPGLTKTIVRNNIGHCCWNDIYKSAEFWDMLRPKVVVKPTNKITTSNLTAPLPSKGWKIDSATTKNPHGIDANNNVYIMLNADASIYLSNPNESYNLHYSFKYTPPPPVKLPKECMRFTRDGKATQILYDNSTYTGDRVNLVITCGKQTLTLKINGTWEKL